nr:family B DNA polymerase [uncultured Duncaniella sp.]
MELQEGNVVPEEKSLEIKGMEAFVKSTSNAASQDQLKQILYNDILNSEVVDQLQVLKDIAVLEKEIFNSITKGEKKYFKPAKIRSAASYEAPMRIQGISAAYVYNALREPTMEVIDLTARNSIDIVKVDIDKKSVTKLRDRWPAIYEKALNLLATKEFADGIRSIAIPLNEPVPEWILPFIRYAEIVNDNVAKFPLESIGLFRGSPNNNSTGMIQF